MRTRHGAHLVFSETAGPVPVLIMPGERTAAAERIDSRGFTGVVVPTEYGSLAVIGEAPESVEPVLLRVQEVLVWDS